MLAAARWQAGLALSVVLCASATVPVRAGTLASDLQPLPPLPPEESSAPPVLAETYVPHPGDDRMLYLHVGALGIQQSTCMKPVLEREPFPTVLPKLLDAGRYPALRSLLSSVRGSEVADATPPEASMAALVDVIGKLIGSDQPYREDQHSRLLRAKASFTLWSEMAAVTEPACVPDGLASALALVPSEP